MKNTTYTKALPQFISVGIETTLEGKKVLYAYCAEAIDVEEENSPKNIEAMSLDQMVEIINVPSNQKLYADVIESLIHFELIK